MGSGTKSKLSQEARKQHTQFGEQQLAAESGGQTLETKMQMHVVLCLTTLLNVQSDCVTLPSKSQGGNQQRAA